MAVYNIVRSAEKIYLKVEVGLGLLVMFEFEFQTDK